MSEACATSSFALPLRLLRREKREAMAALYAFCRAADDAVDNAASREEGYARLDALRQRVAETYEGSAEPADKLAELVRRYGLKRDYFTGLLDGMEMDLDGRMLRPSLSTLSYYCYRVAGCVGLLSLPVLGATSPAAEQFAIALGMGLQHTNILRDLREDAARGRLYLPREWLEEEGIGDIGPDALQAHAREVRLVCVSMAERAERYFEEADRLSAECDRRKLWPALMMRDIYRDGLRRMKKHNDYLGTGRFRPGRLRLAWLLIASLGYWL